MQEKTYGRIYKKIIEDHFSRYGQMAFISGPRQVGKTTVATEIATDYLSWDDSDVRRAIVSGQSETVSKYGLDAMTESNRIVAFDEIHKYPKWKQFLKGFYDKYGKNMHVIATGSAKMDVYKKGGDSMMGRYFPFRMHPFSVSELVNTSLPDESLIRKPTELPHEEWSALVEYGGFPDPFVKRDRRFSRRWNALRFEQLMTVDVRDLTKVVELDQMAILAEMLSNRSGEQLVYSNIANDVKVDEKTIKKWVKVLTYLYFGFEVRPWFKNVDNAIRKTPKWFMRDWAAVEDEGKRAETLVACHLLKAVEGWTDLGLGEFSLHYIRNVQKKEVDFLVARDKTPWFIVEVKKADDRLSETLSYYQHRTGAKHAFQVVLDRDYVNRSCFDYTSPVIVPAKTFLSQLV